MFQQNVYSLKLMDETNDHTTTGAWYYAFACKVNVRLNNREHSTGPNHTLNLLIGLYATITDGTSTNYAYMYYLQEAMNFISENNNLILQLGASILFDSCLFHHYELAILLAATTIRKNDISYLQKNYHEFIWICNLYHHSTAAVTVYISQSKG